MEARNIWVRIIANATDLLHGRLPTLILVDIGIEFVP